MLRHEAYLTASNPSENAYLQLNYANGGRQEIKNLDSHLYSSPTDNNVIGNEFQGDSLGCPSLTILGFESITDDEAH